VDGLDRLDGFDAVVRLDVLGRIRHGRGLRAALPLLSSARADVRLEVPVSRPFILAAALAAALCGSPTVSGQAAVDADPMAALADAERAFARETAKVGIRAGFLAWFAPDAIGFQPTLGNAWERLRARPAPPNPTAAQLEWEPRVGDVAASGELGWLTGPSTFTAPDGSKHYGNYLSIWTRRPEGWRVFIDVGADAPSPVAFPPGFVRMPAAEGRYVAPAPGAGPAAPADPTLPLLQAESLANRDAAGFRAAFATEARYHRPGALPLVGRAAIEADGTPDGSAGATTAGLRRSSLAAAQARAADLGYSYGRFETRLAGATGTGTAAAEPSGYYVRVWRRNASGAWRIVAQVDQPDGR
jgi:ketosteroid isomerase-like protein